MFLESKTISRGSAKKVKLKIVQEQIKHEKIMKRKETANRLNRPWMLAVGIGCPNLYVIVTFKMACEVKIKFFFYVLILLYLIILIKECKIPYKNLDKALLFLRNQVFCLKI